MASPGCFLIPAFDAEVPLKLTKDRQRAVALARFSQAAAAAGVPLPEGSFLSVDEVVHAQWNQYVDRKFGQGTFTLPAEPVVAVVNDALEVVICASSNLDVFQLKPVVEKLESAALGLGWFVQSVLQEVNYHGHTTYDTCMSAYMLDSHHGDLDEFTDECYARWVIDYQEGGVAPKGPIPPVEMARLKDEYGFWPSDILAEIDGHLHLLGYSGRAAKQTLNVMTARKARAWLKANSTHELARVVELALELDRAIKLDSKREFVWNSSEDESECVGALCFVAWDDPRTLLEAVEHYEQMLLSGGQSVEAFARYRISLDEDPTEASLRAMAKATVAYLNRWVLLSKLLSHFPIWDGMP